MPETEKQDAAIYPPDRDDDAVFPAVIDPTDQIKRRLRDGFQLADGVEVKNDGKMVDSKSLIGDPDHHKSMSQVIVELKKQLFCQVGLRARRGI